MTEPDMHTRQAIIRVGGGRGFVVEDNQARRLVVTAAHCLPRLPPAVPALDLQQKTYEKLLGRLDAKPTVWCECVFVDPVADIAVLGCPDAQDGLLDQARAYNKLVDNVRPLPIAASKVRRYPPGKATAHLLSLEGKWRECMVERVGTFGTSLVIEEGKLIASGMSGSPIVSTDGKAIGLVSASSEGSNSISYGNPVLRDNLPAWFFP
jgi:hypothetical protein